MTFRKNTVVQHPRFGFGRVRADDGESVVVRFDHGIEECFHSDLSLVESIDERATAAKLDPALNVVTRVLGNCILSVNDAWGVFSRSRIALLPHQLWVCKRVLESWPTRWLIADDVGLGKTIEAGLILTPLLSSGRVRRLLILTPASLVQQWQTRLRDMFDIRIASYGKDADIATSDYWNTHDKVVASAQTLRLDTDGRWERLIDAAPWDLIIVDEAHHLNVEDGGRRTLSFELVERLQSRNRITSLILFTGTPHRGKDFGFLSLLKLLKPDDFDPQAPLEDQVEKLRTVMIRNNKQRVTDMKGSPLFTPIRSRMEMYSYSPEESYFYSQLTDFISSGRAYAAGLGQQQRRMAILVLIAMQKLASSSVAAVRRALARRLSRLMGAKGTLDKYSKDVSRFEELVAEDDPSNLDELSALEERLTENLGDVLHLNPNEIPALQELINAADAVIRETKIDRILGVVEQSFPGQSVLFFTEYKATQALLMSSLMARFGDGCVTFINGDEYIEGVKSARGKVAALKISRQKAAERFNRGDVRFLVSTEAAGEGIDLQEQCSVLIHVDLPWNPMRLHQRVGRISRYGQTRPVDVVTLHNPGTVESRIWECLDLKLGRITLAFQGAMDDPEDMRQLVIGMASPRMLTRAFAEADRGLSKERLEQWFDAKTATFGGQEAIRVVKNLFGHVARFDFGQVVHQIPKVDLPDLIPFFKVLFAYMGKRPNQSDGLRLSFRTPHAWTDDFTIAEKYDLLFAREPRPLEGEDVAGVGLRVVDRAIATAVQLTDGYAALGELEKPVLVFAIRDRITGEQGAVRKVIVGMELVAPGEWTPLWDWELLKKLNTFADRPRSPVFDATPIDLSDAARLLAEAEAALKPRLQEFDLPFRLPSVERLACLLPGRVTASDKG